MFAKECMENMEWNDEKKKCGEVTKSSKIKTLANTFKLKTLLAKQALTAQQQQDIQRMNTANEERGQRLINQIQEAHTAREMLQLEKQTAMQNEVIRQANAQLSQDIFKDNEEHTEKQVLQLQQQIDQHNAMVKQDLNSIAKMKDEQKRNDQNGRLKQAFGNQSDLVKRMNFWSKVKAPSQSLKTNASELRVQEMEKLFDEEEVTTTTTTTVSPRDQMLLDQQLRQQEQMIAQQRFREELMMKQQELTNQFMIKQRKLQEEQIVKQQRELQQKQIEQQSMQLNSMIARQRKEREMCSRVTCPQEYRCVLNEEDTLVCLHTPVEASQ